MSSSHITRTQACVGSTSHNNHVRFSANITIYNACERPFSGTNACGRLYITAPRRKPCEFSPQPRHWNQTVRAAGADKEALSAPTDAHTATPPHNKGGTATGSKRAAAPGGGSPFARRAAAVYQS